MIRFQSRKPLIYIYGFRGRIGWIARTFCLQLLEKINGTIIRDFGSPFVAGDGFEENIGTTDVAMDDGVRLR